METEEPDPLPKEPQGPALPSWVPVLIGVVLVSIAGLAVWTGLRYRASPAEKAIGKSGARAFEVESGGAPGEPQAGDSRVSPGDAPAAASPDPESAARVSITGGPRGIESAIRYRARRGAWFSVDPPGALIFINEQQIGPANQFAAPEEAYEFPDEGKFSVRIVAPDHNDELLIITTDPEAPDEVVKITRRLVKSD